MTPQQVSHLVRMAKQIALNLGAGHDDAAAEKTAQHINRFWTPAMRRQLLNYSQAGGDLDAEVRGCLKLLKIPEEDRSEQE